MLWSPEVLELLELELHTVVSYHTWVLETKLRSSERVASTLNHSTTSLAHIIYICYDPETAKNSTNSSFDILFSA